MVELAMDGVETRVAADPDDLRNRIELAVAESGLERSTARYWLEQNGVWRVLWPLMMRPVRRMVRNRILPEFIKELHAILQAKSGMT